MNLYLKKQNFFWPKLLIRSIILILILLVLNIFQLGVRNSFYTLSSPLSHWFVSFGNRTSSTFNYFSGVGTLQQKNTFLEEENKKLMQEVAALQDSARQKEVLATALQKTEGENLIMRQARIIGINSTTDTLVIDAGSADGMKEGMPLLSSEKVIVGKIIHAYSNFSDVLLVSSEKSVVDVKIQNNDPAEAAVHGAVKGKGGFEAYLDLVNSNASLKEGDVVVTSGLEGIFPSNLLVGTVQRVSKNDLKPFQTASLSLFFNPQATDSVFVVTNYKQEK